MSYNPNWYLVPLLPFFPCASGPTRAEPDGARRDDEKATRPNAEKIRECAGETHRSADGKQAEICRTGRKTHGRDEKRTERESFFRHDGTAM